MNERIINVAKDLEDVASKIKSIADGVNECAKEVSAAAYVLREPDGGEEKGFRFEARFFTSETLYVYAKDKFEAFEKAKKEAALMANDDYIGNDVEIAPLADNGLVAGGWYCVDVDEELEDEEQ